jgi:hypothetical protein
MAPFGQKRTFERPPSAATMSSMKLVFIYGPVASGKLTIARELGRLTGYAVFHNHLIVDALAAVFPFGTEQFVRLREAMWLDVMREAAESKRPLIFTFAPEPTVAEGFHKRVVESVAAGGGRTHFVQLTVPAVVQEARLTAPSRGEFGKLRSLDLLRELRAQFEASERAMPRGQVVIDTSVIDPAGSARLIVEKLGLPLLASCPQNGNG